MFRILRCLVVCLLMLTLPFQGAAAAVMAMSMAGDEAGMAMQQDMPGMQMAGCHDEMPGMSGAMVDSHQPAHDQDQPAKVKVCGNCCSSAMDALQVPLAVLPMAGNAYLAWPSLEPEGIVPEGLERPPRQIS